MDLERIERLTAAATASPWWIFVPPESSRDVWICSGRKDETGYPEQVVACLPGGWDASPRDSNAEFIVYSREVVPELIAALDGLRRLLERSQVYLRKAADIDPGADELYREIHTALSRSISRR